VIDVFTAPGLTLSPPVLRANGAEHASPGEAGLALYPES